MRYISKLHNPIYLFILFGLVAFLSGTFSGLGTEGITFLVVGSAGVIILAPVAFKALLRQWRKLIAGKPSKLDFMAAPSGYRRARYAESEQEAIAKTVVVPTPHRPLVIEEKTQGIDFDFHNASTVAVPPELIRPQAARSRTIEPVKMIDDPSNPRLKLASDCMPPLSAVLGHSVLGVGMRGSGKTSLAALMIEQIGEQPIPMAIFDYEEDYITLPSVLREMCVIAGSPDWGEADRYGDGYWEVSPENADEIGYEILERGLQMVVEIGTYVSLEDAASVMTGIIKGMFAWADDHDPDQRVPCLVFLDEAQHFLPQDSSVSNIAGKQEANDLLKAFMDVNARGRKRGFTLAVFTQRIAQIRKEVIAGSEIYFFGKQTMDNDLNRYEDIVGKNKLDRVAVQTLKAGTFAVFEGGEIFFTKMYTRKSEHRGKTPGLENAVRRYSNRSSVTTQKFRSVQTALLDEEIDTESGEDIKNDESYPFSPSRQSEMPRTLTPIIPDKGRRAEDVDLNAAIAVFNTGKTSRYDLAKVFGLGESQGRKLKELIEAQVGESVGGQVGG